MEWLFGIAALALAGLVAANIAARRMYRYGENLREVDRVVRDVFWSQHVFLELLLLACIPLCLLFADELTRSSLGRAVSGFMGVFWGLRLVMQFVHYDAEERRKHRALDLLFVFTFLYLTVLFAASAGGLWA